MAYEQGNLIDPKTKKKIIGNTATSAVADIARGNQPLSATLAALIERNALGYPAFTATEPWAVGAIVFNDRKLWKFTSAHTANTPWDANEVAECSIRDLLPVDVARTASDATFVNANKEALFYMRQANENLAGLMTSAEHKKLAALPTAADLETGIIYDVSALHPTSGVNGGSTYASLSAALTVIPQAKRKGGMTVKFVLSSDNHYVQFRYMGTDTTGTPNPFLNTANWQGVDEEPTAGSNNLVKSGGAYKTLELAEANSNLLELIQGNLTRSFDSTTGRRMLILITDDMIGINMNYSISINGSTSGYASIEVYDSTGTRIGNYGKASSTSTGTSYSGTITIPQNASYCMIFCTLAADYTISMDSYGTIGDIKNEEMKLISSFSGVVKKQIVPSETVLFTDKDVKYGQKILYSITCLDETVTGKNAYIELLDSTDTRISVYGKTSSSTTSSNYIGSFDIPLNFSKAVLRGTMSEIRIDYLCDSNIKDLFDGAGNNEIKYSPEIAKLSGILAYNVNKNDGDGNSTIEVLGSSDVSTGDKLYYKIKINGEPVGVNAYIELLDANNTRLAIYGKTGISQTATIYEGSFVVPENFGKVVLKGSANMTLCYIADELINPVLDEKIESLKTEEDAKIEALQTAIGSISGVNNVSVINAVSFPNTPIVILSPGDQDATEYDNASLGYSKIMKISEDMYYLYYSCLGEHGSGDTAQRLGFAYSTDGFTYYRGFPQGITPPVAGTNLIADFNIREQDIFRVLDDEYPYRMVANDDQYNMMMYKSQDAIHFDFVNGKKCCIGQRDCQVSAIPRGQIIKLYVRGSRTDQEHPLGTRAVAIAYCDIDGNIIAPAVSALPYNSLYQASAFALDDHREMLFPTFFNSAAPITVGGGMGGDGTQTLRCYIVNGERCDEVTINTSNIITPNIDNSFYVMPGLINIGNDVYILMVTCPWYHKPTDLPPAQGYSELKLVKVNLSASQ